MSSIFIVLPLLALVVALLLTPCDACFRRSGNNKCGKPFKVVITGTEASQRVIDLLEDDIELVHAEPTLTDIMAKIPGADGIVWAVKKAINATVLDAAGPQLRTISTMTDGIDYVDLNEVKRRNVSLGQVTTLVNKAVADLVVGLLISAGRRFNEGRKKIETGKWENNLPNWMVGRDLRDSVVGFYGFGGIGQAIAKRLSGFDIDQVLYTAQRRIKRETEKELNAKKVDFDELLAKSDFVVSTESLTPATKGVFNATSFNKMKYTAVLINIGDDKVVNQLDLIVALLSNRIFAVGLDIINPKPLTIKNIPLHKAILLPHIAPASYGTRYEMATVAAENLRRGLERKPLLSPAY
ncbi:glyoxylate reductase/hydroxypyruvate reductase [Drosophila mojavensis]|uniref:Glyoxylate reductase/hydroxypyruvate reductase n=1 Tax=Drosophila mojavensis TaxID=7230 RepID=B4KL13_DROMO|nr:glyoxylate reductase/hydroxypyruvate reductase [Drosophila mojavensis]EDW12763.1 uncharacterized protein Dmoj_GI23154 [Drosophila mojavensis]